MIHASENNSSTRVTMAPSSPSRLAFACCSSGSFPERIEMKMMLSTPRTISRKVSVPSAIQICGSLSDSITTSFLPCLQDVDAQLGPAGRFVVVDLQSVDAAGERHAVHTRLVRLPCIQHQHAV